MSAMAGRAQHTDEMPRPPTAECARVLLIEAPFYGAIAEALAAGAVAELEAAGAAFERVAVPGALEIPLALSQAVQAGLIPADATNARFDGCVALGCVIRGETSHYETVCANANHWLMEIAVRHAIPLGNAILTVETEAQALARAQGGRRGKGADAVRACLALIAQAHAFAARPGGGHGRT
jgi:6,7-dimethyl-8-ribityllumazine synthase